MHVIHFTVNICTCSEKVKYELKKNEISQLFKAKIFCVFHTRDPENWFEAQNILLCIFHSRSPAVRGNVPAGGENGSILWGPLKKSQRSPAGAGAVCVQVRISHEELFS